MSSLRGLFYQLRQRAGKIDIRCFLNLVQFEGGAAKAKVEGGVPPISGPQSGPEERLWNLTVGWSLKHF